MEEIYPKRKGVKDKSHLPYKVVYRLAYDGGGSDFEQFYHTRLGAKFSAFLHQRFRSWGGTAVLYANDYGVWR